MAEVAVIATPDDRWIEAICAVVVTKEDIAAEDLIAHARSKLAGYKVPKRIEFAGELPRNASGKLLKRVLRDEILQNG